LFRGWIFSLYQPGRRNSIAASLKVNVGALQKLRVVASGASLQRFAIDLAGGVASTNTISSGAL
jgi:hypothetical protein